MAASDSSKSLTFLFTDLEGSTKLWEAFPERMQGALARHDAILRRAVEGNGGRVIKSTGDGVHAAFESGASAVAAALDAQQTLAQSSWDEIQPHALRVRIGVHTGEAQARGGDYYGPALNRAARLMAVGHGGQTLLSNTTANLVRDHLPPETSLRDLGQKRLKDLVRPEHIFQLDHPQLRSDFPPVRSVDAFPNNLPVQITSFVGRERELEQARERLASTHLLTLIGPGGTGKTRLSLQLAAEVLPSYPDGVWVAELASVADPALVTRTVATAFGLRDQQGMPIDELLIDFLREKSLLLVIDNCEHLVDACAQLIERLLLACANLKILASSREALGIAGEAVYRVPSLGLPNTSDGTLESVGQSESVQLFSERAFAANPQFTLSAQNAPAVAQIVRRLDGIPLALELAAARLTTFSAEQVAARLDDRFRLLTGGSRTALPRQQTLRALIDWSYDLLGEGERSLFRRFAVFAGGCTYEAIEQVCSQLDVLDLLTQLVNKSLVAVEEEDGETRYRLLETIRQYARDKLVELGEAEEARRAHFGFFMKYVQLAAPKLGTAEALIWIRRLDTENDNIRAALEWGIQNELGATLQLFPDLVWFWNRRGHEEEGRNFITAAMERAEQLPVAEGEAGVEWVKAMGAAWNSAGALAYSQGDNERGIVYARRAVELARRSGDNRGLTLALGFLGSSLLFVQKYAEAMPYLEEAVSAGREADDRAIIGMPLAMLGRTLLLRDPGSAVAREYVAQGAALMQESGDRWFTAMSLLALAITTMLSGDHEGARRQLNSLTPLFEELGDRHRGNMVRSELAHIDRREGQLQKAESAYRETIAEWKRLGHRAAVAHQLECFAILAQTSEDGRRAAQLYGAAEALRQRIGIAMTPAEKTEYDVQIDRLKAGMQPKDFSAAWAAGRAMSLEHAVAFALENQPKTAA
ncbi:MAG TPA: adenylate/guanylate cyclase domain-containing protein [Anaerolineales bacterium]|nr:adenylate/guanylate cyclase domain-containing protein [Anaerolineales bacterium]